jgi:hypothetical protein
MSVCPTTARQELGRLFGENLTPGHGLARLWPQSASCDGGLATPYLGDGRILVAPLSACHLNGEGMDAALQFGVERFHDGTMLGHTGHSGERGRCYADPEVALATLAVSPMPPMFFALIEDFKMAWREFDRKFFCNLVANGHMDTGSICGAARARN